jgi:hypothetical protein
MRFPQDLLGPLLFSAIPANCGDTITVQRQQGPLLDWSLCRLDVSGLQLMAFTSTRYVQAMKQLLPVP